MKFVNYTLLGLVWFTISCVNSVESEDNFVEENTIKNSQNPSRYVNDEGGYDCENPPSETIELMLQDGTIKIIKISAMCNSTWRDFGDSVETQDEVQDNQKTKFNKVEDDNNLKHNVVSD